MRFVAFFALLAGCAASAREARVALTIQGAAAGAAVQQRCLEAFRHAGAVVDDKAAVTAIVTFEATGGHLQVMSPSRGLVRDEASPTGAIEPLCRDAARAAAGTPEAVPSAFGNGQPTGEVPAQAVPPTASGGAYRGPISQ